MATPLSSDHSSIYDASTPASADTPSASDIDITTDPATAQPFPALTSNLTTPSRRFLGFPQDARSTPGVGRLRDYAFPVYDGESRRWFLLRVTDANDATAGEIDAGKFNALEDLYGILGEAVDASTVETAPAPPPVEAGDGEGEGSGEVDLPVGDNVPSTTITNKTTAITISLTTSTITATSSFPEENVTPGTYYAPLEDYKLPRPPKKAPPAPTDDSGTQDQDQPPKEKEKSPVTPVSRYGLLEVTRLAPHVDLVAPVWNSDERLVFKHYDSAPGLSEVWNAVQFPLHLAPLVSRGGGNTNGVVMPIKNLVTHERTRDERSGRVVGFTVPYYPGGSLADKRRRGEVCKLEWTRGLFEVVDEVNLECGVVHGGVKSGRTFIDDEEKVVLGGWGQARKRVVGGEGGKGQVEAGLEEFNDLYQDDERGEDGGEGGGKLEPDVVAAVLLVHEVVTRDPEDDKWAAKHDYLFSGVGLDAILKGPWRAHPKAVLDAGAEEYRAAVVAWLDKREKDPRVKEEGKDVGFDEKMPVPEDETADVEEYEDPLSGEMVTKVAVSGVRFHHRDAIKHRKPVVGWVRPVVSKVEEGRRLLVTGHYARTEEEKKKNDLKRRRDGEERGRGAKRARGGGRDNSRGGRAEWGDRPHHGPRDGESGRGRREHTFGDYRVTKPGDAFQGCSFSSPVCVFFVLDLPVRT
ncbi:hypothetical protein QBC39DRAFT_437200 [Podospora conica]|nr:hypothetical protein QBC39DRAFT_437200 [Schizothecium conicum]